MTRKNEFSEWMKVKDKKIPPIFFKNGRATNCRIWFKYSTLIIKTQYFHNGRTTFSPNLGEYKKQAFRA